MKMAAILRNFSLFSSKKKPASPEINELEFKSNGVLTLGVEIELQLINPQNYNLTSRAKELLDVTASLKKVKPEFYQSTIEINTGICNNTQEAERDISQTMDTLTPIADNMGLKFSSTGCHPFARYSDCIISPTERYYEMIDRNQWLTRRMTVYGLHVHIGVESGEQCIRLNNFLLHFLPHLLALSSSSPFWQGTDTGLSSCRPTTYEALPTAGQPYIVKSWRDFEYLYHTLKKCGSIKVLKDLWWDLRPSPGYGTLEIRVCDGPATLQEAIAIVAFIHSMAHWFHDNGDWLDSVPYPPQWLSRENKWRAMRYGLNADIVLNTDGKTKSLREDIKDWIRKIAPYTEKLGYSKYMNDLLVICEKGTSSERQRAIFRKNESLEEVAKFNVKEFTLRKPIYENATSDVTETNRQAQAAKS